MKNKTFDTIVALAVIEHIPVGDVFEVFHSFKKKLWPDGMLLTTPTPRAKPGGDVGAEVMVVMSGLLKVH